MKDSQGSPGEAEKLLRDMVSVQPPPGLEDRVLRKLRQIERQPVRPQRFAWRQLAAVLTLSVMAITAVEVYSPKRVRVEQTLSDQTLSDQTLSDAAIARSSPAVALPDHSWGPLAQQSGSAPARRTSTTRPLGRHRLLGQLPMRLPVTAAAQAPSADVAHLAVTEQDATASADGSTPDPPLLATLLPGTPLPALERAGMPAPVRAGVPAGVRAGVPGQPLPEMENAGTPGHALPQFAGAVPGTPLPSFAAAMNTGDRP